MKEKFRKGISLYFTVILLSTVLVISLGLTTILISQMKSLRGIGYSTKAFYAADTGVERALYKGVGGCPEDNPCSSTLPNGSSYSVYGRSPGSVSCDSSVPNECIFSLGSYKDTNRRIKSDY